MTGTLAIIKSELWQRRFSIVWWSIGVAAFIAVNLAFYPSFKDQSQQLSEAMSQIPESAVALFSDTGEFFSPVGYLSSQVFYLMLPLLLGILAISLGSSLLAREEKDGTLELLLSRPISRSALLTGKLIAGLVITLIPAIVATLVTIGLAKLVELEVSTKGILLASVAATLLSLSFGGIAFLLTALGKMRIASVAIATLFALGGYIISSLTDIASWLKWPAKLFPFSYYMPAEIMNDNYNWMNILYILGLLTVCVFCAFIVFRKRDIE
jgi:ABC-2 type transport system permease protein